MGTAYLSLGSIDSITLRGLEIINGNSAAGEFDYNKLTLALNGVDTGILLNGFEACGSGVICDVIQNFTATPPANASALLTSLQSTGTLSASIIDATPNDNSLQIVGGGKSITLDINGSTESSSPGPGPGPAATPEPATWLTSGGALLLMLGLAYRRRKEKVDCRS